MATKTAIEVLSAKERRILRLIDDPRTSAMTFMHIENAIFNSEDRSYLYATPDIVYHLAVSPRVSDMALRKMATIDMVPPGFYIPGKSSEGEIDYLMQCSAVVRGVATSNIKKRSRLTTEKEVYDIAGIKGTDPQIVRAQKVFGAGCELPVSAPKYWQNNQVESQLASKFGPFLRNDAARAQNYAIN